MNSLFFDVLDCIGDSIRNLFAVVELLNTAKINGV
jgi:hypothetical protein